MSLQLWWCPYATALRGYSGFRIQEGNYGATRLDNLNVVLYAQTPGPKIFDGNWTMGVYLDQAGQ